MTFIEQLTATFNAHRNPENASHMHNYMRGKFPYFGIKTALRRNLLKEVVADHQQEIISDVRNIARNLYKLPERELHLCAVELIEKQLRKKYAENDITLIETVLTTNAWWDTVDFISKQILGNYLLQFPDQLATVIHKFTNSDHLWLNRSTIIFQLGYKQQTNEAVLYQQCRHFKVSDEFFIKKAIGWSLREYAKTNPKSVLNFVNSTSLKSLSRKEAIRNIV